MSVHFTSKTDQWATPPEFFAKLAEKHDFALDPCALPETAKCNRFFTPAIDGLAQDWSLPEGKAVFMNPPYGREISKWVKKAYETAQGGTTVVCLLPARTDTAWWHDYCAKGSVEFIRGRLKFVSGGGSDGMPPSHPSSSRSSGDASFPSAIVIFKGK